MSGLHPLLVQLSLKVGEHLEELTFGGEPGFVNAASRLWHNSRGSATFFDVFDKNVGMGKMIVGRPRAPSSSRLVF